MAVFREGRSWISNGNISPGRFCIFDRSNAGRVIAANGTSIMPDGISPVGTNAVPYSSLDTGYHRQAGQTISLHGPGEMNVLLMLDANCTFGDKLGPVSGGNGTPVTANASVYGAIALANGLSGNFVPVEVVRGVIGGG